MTNRNTACIIGADAERFGPQAAFGNLNPYGQSMPPSVVTIGDWIVDRDTNSIRRDEENRRLQPLSIDVLLYLAKHADRLVTTHELLDTLWPRRIVGDDAVHRRIANLRKMLGDSSRDPKYILTVSKRGYRLIASVGHPAAMGVPGSARRRLGAKAVAVLLISIALFVAAQIQSCSPPYQSVISLPPADSWSPGFDSSPAPQCPDM